MGLERVSTMWTNMSIRSLPDQFSRLNTAGQIGVGLLGVYGSYVGAKVVYGMYKHLANGKIRRKKQQENAQSIEDLAKRLKRDPLPVDHATYITHLSLSELSSALKEGKIRPIEALKAYQSKALDTHSKTNCLVEVITQAEEWALELEKGPREGALWGVPISIKDDVGIKGYDSTIGLVIKVGKPSPDTAELLKVLLKEGAIPFVKTNVPQTEMSFEPGNPINGVVHNPHRHGYGPGGSSSGEAALIASGGSLLGIGSDLGGSIRVPAHFCGLFGFKPTSERISTRGMSLDQEATQPIRGIWGPLSRDMEGVETVMKALWEVGDMAKADPECIPMGFDTKTFTCDRKLRIGYYLHNGLVPSFSACVRATEKAKNVLSSLGHELVLWQPPEPAYIFDLTLRVFQADGGKAIREELRYDKIDPTIATFTQGLYTPVCIKKLLSYLIHPFNAEFGSQIYSSCGAGDVAGNAELTYELWKLRRMIQDSWNAAGLDAVICPPQAIVAPPLGNSELLFATCLFTATYNMLHFPAGVVPVTSVLQTDVDQLQQDFPPGNRINSMARHAMSDTVDLPVGVMVASARYHDETCLRVMKMIDEGLQKGN